MKKVLKILGWIIGFFVTFWLSMTVLETILYGADFIISLKGWWYEKVKWIYFVKDLNPNHVEAIDKIYLAAFYAIPIIMILSSVIILYRNQITNKFRKYKINTKSARIAALEKELEELKNKS